jgi:hypothetical protein
MHRLVRLDGSKGPSAVRATLLTLLHSSSLSFSLHHSIISSGDLSKLVVLLPTDNHKPNQYCKHSYSPLPKWAERHSASKPAGSLLLNMPPYIDT